MLRIDYLVQIIALPDDLAAVSNQRRSALYSTYCVYKVVLESRLLWRVWHIDQYEKLWIEVNFINAEGEAEFHTLAIDKGTYVTVEFDEYYVPDRLE